MKSKQSQGAPQARFFSGFCITSTFFFFLVSHVILGVLVQLFSRIPEIPGSLTTLASITGIDARCHSGGLGSMVGGNYRLE